jgi:hypothetical protein
MLSCFSRSQPEVNVTNNVTNYITNNVSNVINNETKYTLSFSGETFHYKTNLLTKWINCVFYINTETNTIDGYGTSVYKRTRSPFILLGHITKIEKNGDKWFLFRKIHSMNTIIYKGLLTFGSNKITIVSQIASGELIINF